MITQNDVDSFVKWCERNLALASAQLPEEYYYNSLPFCVIDCIYAINHEYKRPVPLVNNYCSQFTLERIRADRNKLPIIAIQHSVSNLVKDMQVKGLNHYTNNVFRWHQSVKTGKDYKTRKEIRTLKTDIIFSFAGLLCNQNIEYFQDMPSIRHDKAFEQKALAIKGIADLTLSYFFMLAGDDNTIKFDRWLDRNAIMVLGRKISIDDGQYLYRKACNALNAPYPHMTPRLLDCVVWEFMRKI